MNAPVTELPDPLDDALIAAQLCAIDSGLGGLAVRGGGELCDAVVAELRSGLPDGAPMRRVPISIDDDRLLGGIDLTATLAKGVAVARAGLLAEADKGIIVLPMAERISDATAGRLAATIDSGEVIVERDGATLRVDARFLTVVLDEGYEPDERPPAALMERLAFWIDLSGTRYRRAGMDRCSDAPSILPETEVAGGDVMDALAATAVALGIGSARAPIFAFRVCRASARLAGREFITQTDVTLAVRLVLVPRATQFPSSEAEPEAEPPPPPEGDGDKEESKDENNIPEALEDIVLAAALASLPKDVLARIAAGAAQRGRATNARGAGERRKSGVRGRPMGARAGVPGGGRRLSLIDTLRAAAPWQKLRNADGRVVILRDDLRIRRFETRAEAVTIFAVDASGSSALTRLAEAKGAVELLLAEAYVKRAQVALVAFRGTAAEVMLPPTRSLARARRSLAELPGGGGTPLAAGLNAARELAEAARARGKTPFIVVLTDGRANIAADGSAVRATAAADAMTAAKAMGAAGIAGAFLDISARPAREGAELAAAMRARYLPLPRADAMTMHAAISAVQPA